MVRNGMLPSAATGGHVNKEELTVPLEDEYWGYDAVNRKGDGLTRCSKS